jgi:hypothetical protein
MRRLTMGVSRKPTTTTTMKITINCSSCRRGEIIQTAYVAVTGLLNRRFYRANLCFDHLEMMLTDGLEIRTERKLTRTVDELRDAYTHACATESLDADGLVRIDAARQEWAAAMIEEAEALAS